MDITTQDIDTSISTEVPEGYEAREVVWPSTGERFQALFPVQSSYSFGG
jgi:hypothetical protein